jgi:hypothetical protein
VSGYSQGGQVVGDILGGGGGVFFQDCVEDKIAGLSPDSRPGSSSKSCPDPAQCFSTPTFRDVTNKIPFLSRRGYGIRRYSAHSGPAIQCSLGR